MKNFEEIIEKFQKLEEDLTKAEIISNPRELKEKNEEYNRLKEMVFKIKRGKEIEKAMEEAQKISQEEKDAELRNLALEEKERLSKEKENIDQEIKLALKPVNPLDKKNIIMEIRAGAGGDESALFAADLFRVYSRFAERKKWKAKIISSHRIGIGGMKEIILNITGSNVYQKLKYESGVHRVQRVPETEKSGRIHTSTATVAVLPEAEEIDIKINPKDLKIDTFLSSGHGGQSVQTTYSAVRITHLPTNLVVSCQDERSQIQNREKAMQILRSKLFAMEEEKKLKEETKERRSQIGSAMRAEKIRTYNFPQDRFTDHRLQRSWHGLNKIMDGELDEIINELINKNS